MSEGYGLQGRNRMSDVLPDGAPTGSEAVPTGTPSDEPDAVTDGSAGGEAPKVVPAERFNGLQSEYQRYRTESENRLAAFEASLVDLRNQQEKAPVTPDGTDSAASTAVLEEVKQLRAHIEQREQADAFNAARAQALKQYPEAEPFADLLTGGTPDDIFAAAQAVSERVA